MTAEGIEALHEALAPVLSVVARIDPSDPSAKAKLDAELPLQGPALEKLRQVVRAGVDARWLADREADGVRWSRVKKAASPGELSIDCVNMDRPGPGHTHPNGEIDLCFPPQGSVRHSGSVQCSQRFSDFGMFPEPERTREVLPGGSLVAEAALHQSRVVEQR